MTAERAGGIQKFIGRRPTAAFGDSGGDLQMLQWATERWTDPNPCHSSRASDFRPSHTPAPLPHNGILSAPRPRGECERGSINPRHSKFLSPKTFIAIRQWRGRGVRQRSEACFQDFTGTVVPELRSLQIPCLRAATRHSPDRVVADHIEHCVLQPKRPEEILTSILDRRQERAERRATHIAELPALASAEKGETILRICVEELQAFLTEFARWPMT